MFPLIQKTKYILSLLTIEPMVLIQGIAENIINVPQNQMILYKTCIGNFISFHH